MGGEQLVARQDEHEEADGEEECGYQSEQRGIVGLQGRRAGLDELDEHGAKAELEDCKLSVRRSYTISIMARVQMAFVAFLVEDESQASRVEGGKEGREGNSQLTIHPACHDLKNVTR